MAAAIGTIWPPGTVYSINTDTYTTRAYSDAERYDLLNKAADHIEQNPHTYNFGNGGMDGRHGLCMLGRMGHIAGLQRLHRADYVANIVLSMEAHRFFREISPDESGLRSAKFVPNAMREFAKRYAPKPAIPDAVRDIFKGGEIQKQIAALV